MEISKEEKDRKTTVNKWILPIMLSVFFICLSVLLIYRQPDVVDEVPCELIQGDIIQEEPAEIVNRICEIYDINKDVIDGFYGPFEYTNNKTWGRIEYWDKGFRKIYIIVPGGGAKVYRFKDEE